MDHRRCWRRCEVRSDEYVRYLREHDALCTLVAVLGVVFRQWVDVGLGAGGRDGVCGVGHGDGAREHGFAGAVWLRVLWVDDRCSWCRDPVLGERFVCAVGQECGLLREVDRGAGAFTFILSFAVLECRAGANAHGIADRKPRPDHESVQCECAGGGTTSWPVVAARERGAVGGAGSAQHASVPNGAGGIG